VNKSIKIAAIAAILFAVTVYVFMQQQTVMRQVVVTTREIPRGTVVTADMVRTELVPVTAFVTGGLASDVAEVVGKTVVAERVAGDVIPLTALGEARQLPGEGNGFVTVTVPLGGAAGASVGDTVSVAVFDHFGGPKLLEGFTVVGLVVDQRDMRLTLEADVSTLLQLVPHLQGRTFAVIRR